MTAEHSTDPFKNCREEPVQFEYITVKFDITETQVVAQIYPNNMTIQDVKKDIAQKFEVDWNVLSICQHGTVLRNHCRLSDAVKNEFGIYDLILVACKEDKDGNIPELNLETYYNKSRLPDFITVHISGEDTSDGQCKHIVVEIQNQAITKPFIGGYKDNVTGLEYHDAFTLTGPNFDHLKSHKLASRLAQTREQKLKLTDTSVDESTQSFGDATSMIFVTAATDFVIVPKKYETYAQREKRINKLDKVIRIQRNLRRVILWRFIQKCASEYRYICENRAEMDRLVREEEERERLYRERAAKGFPRTREDFGVLYEKVALWKQAELRRISAMYSGAPRLAEINIVLDKEIQMLSGIERQHAVIRKAVKEYKEKQLLKKLGKPIQWVGYKDLVIEMDLIRTQRARFLTELFEDLKKEKPNEERLKLLEKVKMILENEDDFPQIAELYDLIEREKNLLIHTKYCDVSVLRQRFDIIFFNLIKFTRDGHIEKPEKRMCECCKQVKPIADFALRTRQSEVDTCQACFNLKTDIADNTVYRAILRTIQRDERKHRSLSSYAFILQPDDIRFIIDNIWHRHSILSKKKNIHYLRLPRWIKSDDWSPWNCICLTEIEARNHNNLKDLNSVYDKKMLLEITNRHLLAKNSFKKLQDVENDFVESGQWWQAGIKDKIV